MRSPELNPRARQRQSWTTGRDLRVNEGRDYYGADLSQRANRDHFGLRAFSFNILRMHSESRIRFHVDLKIKTERWRQVRIIALRSRGRVAFWGLGKPF
jgi:hypothetical protein